MDFATCANPVCGDGETDNTPAFNAALVALKASPSDRTLILPAGKLWFAAKPDDITFSLKMSGQGYGVTTLIRGCATPHSPMLKVTGGEEMYGGAGVQFEDFNVDAGGFDGGVGIWIQAPLELGGNPMPILKGPHGSYLKNVHAKAGVKYPNGPVGSWVCGIYLDGSLNLNPAPGVAQGIRNCTVMNCTVSQYTFHPLYLYGGAGCNIVGRFSAYVPINGADLRIWRDFDQGTINQTNWAMN